MLERYITPTLLEYLATTPAVVLLGPRQVGKTTLAYGLSKIAASKGVALPSIYLDLESTEDLALLNNAEQYLRSMQDKLIILDEVQRTPRLFEPLRGLIDHARRNGKPAGLYLLLGSASLDLVQKSSESLAGRVVFLELSGLHRLEVPSAQWGDLWLRGGYPPSLTAPSLAASIRWRRNFIRTYLERDIPQFAPRIAAERLRRFWTMLAHLQSSTVNVAQLSRNLDVSVATASNYLDLLVDLLMVRKLPPWHNNTGKRQIGRASCRERV